MSVSHLKWQLHDERRARAGAAVDAHGAAELLDDAAHDVRARGPARRADRCRATRLNGSKIRPWSSGAMPRPLSATSSRATPRWLSAPARTTTGRPCPYLIGVGDQVGDDLIRGARDPSVRRPGRAAPLQLRSRAGRLDLHLRADLTDELAQIEGRQIRAPVDPSESVRDRAGRRSSARNAPLLLDHDFQHPGRLGRERHPAALQRLQAEADRAERPAQLVRGDGDQALPVAERVGQLLVFSDVANCQREPIAELLGEREIGGAVTRCRRSWRS